MNDDAMADAIRDPRLAEALRATGPEPPLDAVDWAALRRTITERAALPLARRRGSAPWWAYAAGWGRAAIPAAVAATIALGLLFGALRHAAAPAPATQVAAARIQLETALGASPQGDEVTSTVFAAGDDALVRATVEGR